MLDDDARLVGVGDGWIRSRLEVNGGAQLWVERGRAREWKRERDSETRPRRRRSAWEWIEKRTRPGGKGRDLPSTKNVPKWVAWCAVVVQKQHVGLLRRCSCRLATLPMHLHCPALLIPLFLILHRIFPGPAARFRPRPRARPRLFFPLPLHLHLHRPPLVPLKSMLGAEEWVGWLVILVGWLVTMIRESFLLTYSAISVSNALSPPATCSIQIKTN